MKKLILFWQSPLIIHLKQLTRIMKLSVFIVFATTLSLLANTTKAQNSVVNFEDKYMSVGQFINEIENQTEYLVIYSNSEIDVDREITLNRKENKVSTYLREVFGEVGIDYEFDNNYIILAKEKIGKKVLSSVRTSQQQNTVTGKVIDDTGESLPGVNVTVKGTTIGVMTDFDGNYSINVPNNNSILVYSFIGYNPQEVTVGGQRVINITLGEDVQVLEEVVVVGYGIQRKSDVTGAIASVKTEDMQNRTVTSVAQSMQGKVSGVHIQVGSGLTGSSSVIKIRGNSSNQASSPLYVVDGQRVSDINYLDHNTIESMEILKDAASAAIYGAQAGNGVILITTKTGQRGKSTISYDLLYTSQSLANTPRVLNAADYITYYTEMYGSSFTDMLDTYYDGSTDTDWVGAMFTNSVMQRHTLQMQGGNEKGSYMFSGSYLTDNGILVGDKDVSDRYSLQLNSSYKLTDWLNIDNRANFTYNKSINSVSESSIRGGSISACLMLDPLTPIYMPDSQAQDLLNEGRTLMGDENGYYSISPYFLSAQINPLIRRDMQDRLSKSYMLRNNLDLMVTPFSNFTFTSRFGINLSSNYNNNYGYIYYANSQAYRAKESMSMSMGNNFKYQWENFANYNFKINDNSFTLMAGMSFENTVFQNVSGTADELLSDAPNFHYLDYAASSAVLGTGGEERSQSLLGYFGRLNYDYKGKYQAQVSFRADAADKYYVSEQGRWGYFPSASVGYIVSREEFAQGLFSNKVLSYMKIRGSWGQNGSIAGLGNYSWNSVIGTSGYYNFDNQGTGGTIAGTKPTYLGNNSLTWETSQQLNIGVDTRFFKDRLTFSVDWYDKTTKDLIVTGANLSYSAGNSASPLNGGEIKNTGFEFDLGFRDKIGDFNYGVSANLSSVNNEVTYVSEAVSGRILGVGQNNLTGLTAFQTGYPSWYYRGWKTEGVNPDNGYPILVDINNDGMINTNDQTYIGDSFADFTYGVTVEADYKNFDLKVFGSGSYGNDIWMWLYLQDNKYANVLQEIFDGRWTTTGQASKYPGAITGTELTYFYYSNAMVRDGSYLKIKQIQLGYSLPQSIVSKINISRLRAYISFDDWFTFTKYDGFDPETISNGNTNAGIDQGNFPMSKKFTFGLNVTF